MNIIDDKGRLFGTINIIDALVVLLVLAVAAAGAALVLQSGGQDTASTTTEQNTTPATRYATLDLGTHPSYVAERITSGDAPIEGNLTVTDVYRIPTDKGVHVWTRVELDGRTVEDENTTRFQFADSHVRPGSRLTVATDEYRVNGTVHDVAERNGALPGGPTKVVLRTTMSAEKADAIEAGDTYTVANDTVATVEAVDVYPTAKSNQKRVVLGVTMDTLAVDGQRKFLGRPVQIGQPLSLATDAYSVEGQVTHRGSLTPPGERTTTTVTVKLAGVSPDLADAIETGMVERGDGDARARLTDKRVENATVVVNSQNGDVYAREHPRKKDVYLTVELDARRTDSALYFHGKSLQNGNAIVLDFGSITVNGRITEIRRTD